jgi:arabinogalactan oligomer / maltooligosaccharide transport system substrate-binding protein
MRRILLFISILLLLITGCGPKPSSTAKVSIPHQVTNTPGEVVSPGETAYPALQDTAAPAVTNARPGVDQSTSYPPPQETATQGAYPPPGNTQVPTPTSPRSTVTAGPTQYPGPEDTFTPVPPGQATPTARRTPGPTSTLSFEVTETAAITVTPSLTGTERPISTAMPPPGTIAQTIHIWHSWDEGEVANLDFVLKTFQDFYPDVAFDVQYVPQDELFDRYEMAAYRGGGPSVIFGPAEWGPLLFEKGLVADLTRDADPKFLAEINPAALGEARFRGALIGLPLSIREGVLLFRNKTLIPERPATFDDLIRLSRSVTKGGRVGAYLDRSFFYSAAHLYGLGGRLLDDQGEPAFNTPEGVAWLELLRSFEQAGAADYNTDRDLQLFKEGRIGFIVDGSWNRNELAKAIGEENLAIDAWPRVPGGRLSGFVRADNIYLNANLRGDERYAALLFMGFMMARDVQSVLARGGHIPSVTNVQVNDPLMQQAMEALEGNTPYPIDPALSGILDPLEAALRSVFEENLDPKDALQKAYDEIAEK